MRGGGGGMWIRGCVGGVYTDSARVYTRVRKGPEHHTPPMSVPPPKLTMKVYCYLHALQSFIELLRRAPRNQRLGTPRRRPQRPSSCGRERTGSPSSSFRPWRLQGPCSRSRGRGRRWCSRCVSWRAEGLEESRHRGFYDYGSSTTAILNQGWNESLGFKSSIACG